LTAHANIGSVPLMRMEWNKLISDVDSTQLTLSIDDPDHGRLDRHHCGGR
jgi:hypothetical protein